MADEPDQPMTGSGEMEKKARFTKSRKGKVTHLQNPNWNDEARISCEFTFKCPKVWSRLQPTSVEGVRHCQECQREVHLALTEDDFKRHAEGGHCVAVRVVPPESSQEAELAYMVGFANPPYFSEVFDDTTQ